MVPHLTDEEKTEVWIAHSIFAWPFAMMFDFKNRDIIYPKEGDDFLSILDTKEFFTWDKWDKPEVAEKLQEAGVYAITINSKTFYIGETSRNFATRFQEHKDAFLSKKGHTMNRMQHTFERTKESPKFYILESGRIEKGRQFIFKLYSLAREFYYNLMLAWEPKLARYSYYDSLNKLYQSEYAFDLLTHHNKFLILPDSYDKLKDVVYYDDYERYRVACHAVYGTPLPKDLDWKPLIWGT